MRIFRLSSLFVSVAVAMLGMTPLAGIPTALAQQTCTIAQFYQNWTAGTVVVSPDDTGFTVNNNSSCSYPVNIATLRMTGSQSNQSLFWSNNVTIPANTPNFRINASAPQGCGYQMDLAFGTYSLGLGMTLDQYVSAVNWTANGLGGRIVGTPCQGTVTPPPPPSSPSGQMGCIDVLNEAFDQQANRINPAPFSFSVDNGAPQASNSVGRVTFSNIPAGTHTVTEQQQSEWNQINVTPMNGTLQVLAGNSCVGVVFKNQLKNNSSSSSMPAQCVRLDIRDTPDPARAGDTIDYSIHVTNDQNISRDVQVTATLDNGMEFVDGNNGVQTRGSKEVFWRHVYLASREDSTLRLNVRVGTSVRDGDSLRLLVKGDCGEETETTRIQGDTAPVPTGTVSIQKHSDHDEANPGNIVTYQITVRNDTNTVVRNLSVTDTYNQGQISPVETTGAERMAGTLSWTLDSLSPGQSRSLRYRMQLSSSLLQGDTVSNTATVNGQSSTSIVRIVTQLPQTGVMDFTMPFENTRTYLRQYAGADVGSSGAGAAATWIGVVLTGMGIAGSAARRYFL